jgi:hypothetical protein
VNVVERYLKDLGEIYHSGGGVGEESYYGTLETLLNEIGRKLRPRVRCVGQLKNIGAGEPDFGFFTANQFQRAKDERPIEGQLPERGVIECKGWDDDSFVRTESPQVSKYWKRYGLVLVTNYRDFVLVGRGDDGKAVRLESYRMAQSKGAFVGMLGQPRKAATEQGERLSEFLRRAMLHNAPLTKPEDVAWFLASYAREARGRVEESANLPALEGLKNALEEALGMKFEGEKGEHFFQATLVQTLFYGVFSSWVLWSRENWGRADAKFNWHEAGWTLHVPMVKSLFDQIATQSRLKPLGIDEVLDWAGMVLNRVDRATFFSKFEEEHAVQYFYEPFLKAYDPGLRKALGVWYTPPEIVQYQVERVDQVLREELKIADGLADERVVVLDPCCGTGTYLVETLKRIHKTLDAKGAGALTAQKLKKAAKERVFGFEILPAPFVVAHLQLGLMLRTLGAPLNAEYSERAGVYLTNALTGWEPLEDPKTLLPFPELKEERDKANKVKQEAPILVILGNPPYNAFAGTSPEEEGGLVDVYKEGLTTPVKDGGWGIRKFNLDDLYVRFFRIAERRIVKSGKGIVSYISNYSWTQEPSFVVLRKRLLESFDKFWIENMHGNRKISEYAPDGRTSETVFAIPGFSAGIQQGVVVSLWVRKEGHKDDGITLGLVRYRDDIDAAKAVERREELLASLKLKNLERKYEVARPTRENRYSFRPSQVSKDYLRWASVREWCISGPYNGPIERRGNSLIVFPDENESLELVGRYLDENWSDEEIALVAPAFMKSSGEFDAVRARKSLAGRVVYKPDRIVRYPFKPFDIRHCYLDNEIAPLFSRPSPELLDHGEIPGNRYFITRDTADKCPEGPPFLWSSLVCDYDCISGHARHFPIFVFPSKSDGDAAAEKMYAPSELRIMPNLSKAACDYLKRVGISDPDADAETAGLIWMHALAVGYSTAYLEENADGIRQDWPRIPLPATKTVLLKSAELGRRVAALLDTEKPADGVTIGKIDPRVKDLAVITKVGSGSLDPTRGELEVTAGWGHAGKAGVCMPGKGVYQVRSQKNERLRNAFGDETLDVYLNQVAYWANVPKCVWEYYIGGYQVVKKWLSYREKTMLGRGLKVEEAEYVTEMVRRIASLILLQGELDANYKRVKDNTWRWPGAFIDKSSVKDSKNGCEKTQE